MHIKLRQVWSDCLQIRSKTIPLSQLHLIVKRDSPFVRFVRSICKAEFAVSADEVAELQREVDRFDQQVEQVQCFVSLYCNSAKIDVKVRRRVHSPSHCNWPMLVGRHL